VCRGTLQTVPDILYGLMNGLITCRYAPACRVRGRSRPNGRLLGACPAPPCSCPASALGIAWGPRVCASQAQGILLPQQSTE
jgi:hypothetical protein